MKFSLRVLSTLLVVSCFSLPQTVYGNVPGDRDNDGIPDAEDTCPDRANRDQLLFRYYPDADGDTYGTDEGMIEACEQPEGYTTRGGDCNDGDTAINPSAVDDEYQIYFIDGEYVYGDGIDNDCSGSVDDGPRGRKDRDVASFHEPECSEVGSDWLQKLEVTASNQRYYVVKNGLSTLTAPGNDAEQRIRFERFVGSDFDNDSYDMYVRARSVKGAANSIWVRTNDGPWTVVNLSTLATFQWIKTKLPILKFGRNTVDIVSREEGMEIDQFYLTRFGDSPNKLFNNDYERGCPETYFPPNEVPKAIARATNTDGVAPLSVSFDGTASTDPENDTLTYRWDWAGGSATGPTPTAVFAPGIYEVTLTVTDFVKNTDRATLRVTARDPGVDESTNFWLEAECAEVGANWSTLPRSTASEGGAVVVRKFQSTGQPPADVAANRVRFRLRGVKAGSYHLFARISAPDKDSDSYWVRLNGGNWKAWRQGIRANGEFAWTEFRNERLVLNEGNNVIDFAYRERGATLDKVHLNLTGELPSALGRLATNCAQSPDSDGDGVVDDEDNCPAVPNPDQSLTIYYSDADQDGFGDPNDPIQACTLPEGYVTNARDNCPSIASGDLTDSDGDGIGNLCDDDIASPTNIWLEAECAQLTSGWRRLADRGASGGLYTSFSGPRNIVEPSPANPAQDMQFTLDIMEAGDYRVYLRLRTSGNASNSFWIRFNEAGWVRMWQNIGGTQLSTDYRFQWKRVNSNGVEVTFPLTAGRHTLTVANRESGTSLDKVFVSTRSLLPTGQGQPAGNCTDQLLTPPARSTTEAPVSSEPGPEMQLYPNPTDDQLTFELVSPYTGRVLARMFDTNGRLVEAFFYDKQATLLKQQITTARLTPGLYRLQLIENDRQSVRPFIKQ